MDSIVMKLILTLVILHVSHVDHVISNPVKKHVTTENSKNRKYLINPSTYVDRQV